MLGKTPNASNGTPDGHPVAPAPDVAPPGPDAAKPAPGAAPPDVGPPAPPVAAPPPVPANAAALQATGALDSLPPTWCKKCKADVLPIGKGRCPRCQTFLQQNFSARKHPINVLRKRQILAQLIADYQPSTTILRANCENLAGVLEQLEVMKAGSQEHKRLTDESEQLGATLEASRSTALAASTDLATLTTDQLIERTTEMLRRLLDHRDDETRAAEPIAAHAREVPIAPVETAEALSDDIETWEPWRQNLGHKIGAIACKYCHRRPCVGRDHFAFGVLHWSDPAEIKRRNEDEQDQFIARAQGWPTRRMLDRAREREQPETEEEQRQRAIRVGLGWETPGGTLKT
jgi:hypothetical protein